MKTTAITAILGALVMFGATSTSEAKHPHRTSNSYTYISGYHSCGTPIYKQRYIAGYTRCGQPIWKVRHVYVPKYQKHQRVRSNHGSYQRSYRGASRCISVNQNRSQIVFRGRL